MGGAGRGQEEPVYLPIERDLWLFLGHDYVKILLSFSAFFFFNFFFNFFFPPSLSLMKRKSLSGVGP